MTHHNKRCNEKADAARREWRRDGIVMAERRPMLMRALDRLYRPKSQVAS
jgi:hypothetical protein